MVESNASSGLGVKRDVFATSKAKPTFQLLSEHGQEDGEVDGTRSLLHHLVQLVVANVKATWTERRKPTAVSQQKFGNDVFFQWCSFFSAEELMRLLVLMINLNTEAAGFRHSTFFFVLLRRVQGLFVFYFVTLVLTKSSVGVPQVTLINEAVSVLVHDGEGLKEKIIAREKLKGIQLKLMV